MGVFVKKLTHLVLPLLLIVTSIQLMGCRALTFDESQPNLCGESYVNNPLIVPMMDRWLIMDQISDEIDDYFKIYREQRIRVIDGIMSEGWIETHPKIGSTVLEPWHFDSTPGFEKVHASLQTVRRFAKIRVIPLGDAYQIDVKVYKELEDLPQPIGSAIGGAVLRHDNSLDVDRGFLSGSALNPGWIPMGRDLSLEQLILRNIQQRLTP